jgi:hypothetical protein
MNALAPDETLATKREEAYEILNRMSQRLKDLEDALVIADNVIVLSLESTKPRTYKSAYAATKALMDPPDHNKLPKMLSEAHGIIQSVLKG